MSSGICAYITNAASEEVNDTWVIRHFVQMVVMHWDSTWSDTKKAFHPRIKDIDGKILLWIVSDPQWDFYIAIKSTLTMPGMNRVHERLAWFRKVLLRHKCGTGTHGCSSKNDYTNIQLEIQRACKKCHFKWSGKSHSTLSIPEFDYCDEDFMPNISITK